MSFLAALKAPNLAGTLGVWWSSLWHTRHRGKAGGVELTAHTESSSYSSNDVSVMASTLRDGGGAEEEEEEEEKKSPSFAFRSIW